MHGLEPRCEFTNSGMPSSSSTAVVFSPLCGGGPKMMRKGTRRGAGGEFPHMFTPAAETSDVYRVPCRTRCSGESLPQRYSQQVFPSRPKVIHVWTRLSPRMGRRASPRPAASPQKTRPPLHPSPPSELSCTRGVSHSPTLNPSCPFGHARTTHFRAESAPPAWYPRSKQHAVVDPRN